MQRRSTTLLDGRVLPEGVAHAHVQTSRDTFEVVSENEVVKGARVPAAETVAIVLPMQGQEHAPPLLVLDEACCVEAARAAFAHD
jgi:hypothetical protein